MPPGEPGHGGGGLGQAGGGGGVAAAEGSELAEPLPETEEGILYADLTGDLIAIAKSVADPVGHYSRPDVLRLLINRNPAPRVVETPEIAAEIARTAKPRDRAGHHGVERPVTPPDRDEEIACREPMSP